MTFQKVLLINKNIIYFIHILLKKNEIKKCNL